MTLTAENPSVTFEIPDSADPVTSDQIEQLFWTHTKNSRELPISSLPNYLQDISARVAVAGIQAWQRSCPQPDMRALHSPSDLIEDIENASVLDKILVEKTVEQAYQAAISIESESCGECYECEDGDPGDCENLWHLMGEIAVGDFDYLTANEYSVDFSEQEWVDIKKLGL